MDEEKQLTGRTTITINIADFQTLENLNIISQELNRSWDELINLAIERLLNDIYVVSELRK